MTVDDVFFFLSHVKFREESTNAFEINYFFLYERAIVGCWLLLVVVVVVAVFHVRLILFFLFPSFSRAYFRPFFFLIRHVITIFLSIDRSID